MEKKKIITLIIFLFIITIIFVTFYNVYYKKIEISEEEKIKASVSNVFSYNSEDLNYVDGILVVNKNNPLPKNYDPGVNKEAYNSLVRMQIEAGFLGFDLKMVSGYRTYEMQRKLYLFYVKKHGEKKTNTFSAKPGYSEHQTGLAFDVGYAEKSFAKTDSFKWLEDNCHLYGFIIRYPKGKEKITGYVYEPWHIRYLGIDLAIKVKESGLSLEEYLGIN